MKITLAKPYKSIMAFAETEVPDFVVLTGINGAGKSHLLQAIETGALTLEGVPFNQPARNIRRFDWTNMVPNDTNPITAIQTKTEKAQLWSQFSQQRTALSAQIHQLAVTYPVLAGLTERQIVFLKKEDLIAKGMTEALAEQAITAIANTKNGANQNLIHQFSQNNQNNRGRLLSQLASVSEVPLIAFDESDFYDNFPITWQPIDLFQQSFSRLFVEYQSNLMSNNFKAFMNDRKGSNDHVYTDEEFVAKFGVPPWDFVNEILESANLTFRVDPPSEYDDRPYEALLKDQADGTQIKFGDLSSGEKILISFALCLYYAQDSRQIVEYPRVLLFDEIDAPLHPSMTKSLLNTIINVLVEKHGIKVIMTTHSPSTVAMAPDEAIFVMQKSGRDRLAKTTKDKALSILTTGVPSLSVSYNNRRQVFTESRYDAEFYEMIYSQIKDKLSSEISLMFISTGDSKNGGCNRVMDVVTKLHEAGNNTVYGLIDWDGKNVDRDRIKVFGGGERHSIENYLFDPTLLAALLFRERIIRREELNLAENETHIDFLKFNSDRLQSISDIIANKIKENLKDQPNQELTTCKYINGKEINLPKWYLHMKGHDLEALIRETFPCLKKFTRADSFKRAMVDVVMDELRPMIPLGFLNTFMLMQA